MVNEKASHVNIYHKQILFNTLKLSKTKWAQVTYNFSLSTTHKFSYKMQTSHWSCVPRGVKYQEPLHGIRWFIFGGFTQSETFKPKNLPQRVLLKKSSLKVLVLETFWKNLSSRQPFRFNLKRAPLKWLTKNPFPPKHFGKKIQNIQKITNQLPFLAFHFFVFCNIKKNKQKKSLQNHSSNIVN